MIVNVPFVVIFGAFDYGNGRKVNTPSRGVVVQIVDGEMINKPIDWGEVFEVRMIVLMEDSPQSNKYHQILLNREQFRKVSDTLANVFPIEEGHKCNDPNCRNRPLLRADKFEITLPDIRSIHKCDTECNC